MPGYTCRSTRNGGDKRLKDYLKLHLQDLPYFRALLRAVEARFYRGILLPGPVLDLGCGDGHFASLAFDRQLEVGMDPWWGPLQEAAGRGTYQSLICADGHHMPFPRDYFSSAVSNSVLEHIPDLEPVLAETARVLKPGARFVFCVPNHRFLDTLSIGSWLDKLKLSGLARDYRGFFNRISRHYQCDSLDTWQKRLNKFGFDIEDSWDYFPPRALQVLEWGHYLGLPAWVSKVLFGRWILAPTDWNLYLTDLLVRPHYEREPRAENGVYSFYITRYRN
jgi:SAM-dependent methyltransferase